MMQLKEGARIIRNFTGMCPATVSAGMMIALEHRHAHRVRNFPVMYLCLTIFLKQIGSYFNLRSA
ncbi:hypothetical protein ACWKX9_25660 [Enterobacter asburiae]|uniref:hypothetical protein n=1 Tax=Enterobacter bugandensis TaxID=881260 RepID=UPI002005C274|nr:hypothetical protein [Enterobacter bugandensis]